MTKYLKIVGSVLFVLILFSCKQNKDQEITSNENRNQKEDKIQNDAIWPRGERGSDKFFTGNAYNYGLVMPDSVYGTLVGNVYFEPAARSNWHTHPSGQILIITSGKGYHQIEGQPIEVMRKGDVVKCPPNVKHWHGAAPDSALHQMYIVPNIEKGIVNWMEPVTDAQYTNK